MMTYEETTNYFKNELRSYKTLKKWLKNDAYIFDNRISYYERKIAEIDIQLSAGNAKGIDYDYIPTSAVNEPLLTLLAEQEKYIKRRNELIAMKKEDVYGFKARVKYIEDCLNKLDEKWKRDFLIDYYSNGISTEELEHKYPCEARTLRRYKDELIIKII